MGAMKKYELLEGYLVMDRLYWETVQNGRYGDLFFRHFDKHLIFFYGLGSAVLSAYEEV